MKAFFEMNEKELREIAEKRLDQYKKAEKRVDKHGTFRCIEQAQNYLKKYSDILKIMQQKGYSLNEKEISIIKLV